MIFLLAGMYFSMPVAAPQVPVADSTEYPSSVGRKFYANGTVRRFPGNTIIIPLSSTSHMHTRLLKLYSNLADAPSLAGIYTLLPPSSWHMTVFEGVDDYDRNASVWPTDLPLDMPLVDVTANIAEKLQGFNLGMRLPLKMRLDFWKNITRTSSFSVRLTASTPEGLQGLRDLRNRLSNTLKLRKPDHDKYLFHMTVGYFVRYPTQEQLVQLRAILDTLFDGPLAFELGRPAFCTFEDMFRFDSQLWLTNTT